MMLNAVTLRLQLWKSNLILINPGAKLVLAHAGIALDISDSDRPLRCTSPVRFWGGQNQTCWKKKSRRASTVSESPVSPRSARSIGLHGAACSRASLNRCPGLLVWNYSSVQNELENVEKLFFLWELQKERDVLYIRMSAVFSEYALRFCQNQLSHF